MTRICKIIILNIYILSGINAYAQNEDVHFPVSNYIMFGKNNTKIYDGYLSPLWYDGDDYFLKIRKEQYFKKINNLSSDLSFKVGGYKTYNPAGTADMWDAYLNISYGANYNFSFKEFRHFSFQTGVFADLDLEGRYISNNSNNPGNGNVSVNLNFLARVNYSIPYKTDNIRIGLSFSTPFAGIMAAPEMGTPYYRVYSNESYSDLIHFTSFHNKQNFCGEIFFEIPLKYLALRLALSYDKIKYKNDDLIVCEKRRGISLGCVFDSFYFFRRNRGKYITKSKNVRK